MAVASLLKMFLRELPDSLIPYDVQPAFISAHGLREDKEKHLTVLRHLINKLPQANYDLLKYLITFLNEITESSDVNKMTPVALAVVFGPNIFRCRETLQGLKEQACVNAVTCKLIEQHSHLFSADNSNPDELTSQSSSSIGDSSPRKKPARPPPPKFQQDVFSPRKICEDENSNMLGHGDIIDGVDRSGSDDVSGLKSQTTRSPRHEIKGRNNVKISHPEPNRSKSPPQKSFRNGSAPVDASPSRKQILDNTIRDAVKKNLFGNSIVTSSSESDNQCVEASYSPDDKTGGETNQSSNIRDMLKVYTAGKLSKSPDLKVKSKHIEPNSSDLTEDDKTVINQSAFDQMEEQWRGTLKSLTSNRAPPPRNRRGHRPERKTQSENLDELLKTKPNELLIDDFSIQRTMAKTENPVLVKVKNERIAKSLENLDKTSANSKDNPWGSPKTLAKASSSKANKQNDSNEDNGNRLVPRLDLFSMEQNEDEGHVTRISSKERFASILSDGPIRSPRKFQSDEGAHHVHKQQIFLEKRQDTVPVLDMSARDLKKRIDSLKKIISNFESSFEAQHQRPPKPSEKSQVNKYVAELGRAKKQLRELEKSSKDNPDQSSQDIGFAPNLRDVKMRSKDPTKEDTLNALLKRLNDKRSSSGRPEELEMMSSSQLKDEKLAVQKALLQYENLHGRPTSKEDKTLMRPIYERYRRIKRLIVTTENKEHTDRSEGETSQRQERLNKDSSSTAEVDQSSSDLVEVSNPPSVERSNLSAINEDDLNDTFNITRKPQDYGERAGSELESNDSFTNSLTSTKDAVLHGASLEELLKQQKLARKEKKAVGKTLKDFEDEFYAETGRKVQKEDRGPLESEYRDYKQLKARLRLLEVLITKKKGN